MHRKNFTVFYFASVFVEVINMIKRNLYLNKIRPFYHLDFIKVLIGVRRSGKSVILLQIIDELKEEGISDDHIIYINFEDLDYAFIKNELDLHQYIKELIKDKEKMYYLFFDEIQTVENFEKAMNSFRSVYHASVFITGSNGKLLSGELATFLSGRYVSFKIFPFNFKEVCEISPESYKKDKEQFFLDYMNWGGMPQRFQFQTLQETKVFLNDLYNSIVLRDIVQRTGCKDIEFLNRLVDYLAQTPSQMFSVSKIF